jgi:serine/threonine-protein kinase
MIGKILDGKYEIVELIGQGGMAKVYKAVDNRLHRNVAVKVLKEEFADNEQFLKKFLREARADAKLTHPNIVNVYDVGTEGGVYYIVMEYVDGDTLKRYIKSKKHMSPKETVEMVLAIAAGLSHAHKNGIIHRDIKPHNILLTSYKTPKIADFGIARAITSSTMSATEEALGSVHYVSPEQARGGFLDERSDLYSLGIMMYEMLTGELPYDGDSPVAIALKHVQNNVPSPKDKIKIIPDGLNQVVLNLTRRKPDDRYQNAEELIADIRKLAVDLYAEIKPTYILKDYSVEKEPPHTGIVKKISRSPLYTTKTKLLFAGAIVVFIGVLLFAVLNDYFAKKVSVPDLSAMTYDQAVVELGKLDLKYQVSSRQSSNDVEKDYIISQYPEAGETVRVNTVVKLVVSNGPNLIEVPDVTDLYEKEATSKLTNAGFTVSQIIYEYNDDYELGKVYQQNPSAGLEVKEGSSITIYVSKGKDTVIMPKLTGYSLSEAKSLIAQSGLIYGEVSYEPSSTYDKDIVMSQSPSAYAAVDKNTRVNLVVSLGPETAKTVTFHLSSYTSDVSGSTVSVEIYLSNYSGGTDLVYDQTRGKNDTINVTFTGAGTKTYTLYINGVQKTSGSVTV